MKKEKRLFFISLTLVILIGFIFIGNPDVLLIQLFEEPYVPLGTPLTWLLFIAFPCCFYYGVLLYGKSRNSVFRITKTCYKILILLGFLWLFIAYYLSTNWSTTFGNQTTFRGSYEASKVYWSFNYFLLISPIVLIFIYLILSRLIKK